MRLLTFIIQSKINLAILAVLVAIAGILVRMLYMQQKAALGAAKEAECRQTERAVPDSDIAPYGDAIPPNQYAYRIKAGEPNILYGHSFPSQPRWPGSYFHALTQGVTDRSFLVEVESIQGQAAIVKTPCAPKPFSVPFQSLYNLTVGR